MSRLSRRFHDAEKELNIEIKEGCFHKLRKSFATELIDNNVPVYEVKDLMRHRDINTTLKLYRQKNKQKLVDTLNKL